MAQTLYAFTVLFYVYRLRRQGAKLTKEMVRDQNPAYGELQVQPLYPPGRHARATLVTPNTYNYAVPVIDYAEVRICKTGIMVRGREVIPRGQSIKSRSDSWAQAWWCVLQPLEAQAPAAPAFPLGFDPADDDRD